MVFSIDRPGRFSPNPAAVDFSSSQGSDPQVLLAQLETLSKFAARFGPPVEIPVLIVNVMLLQGRRVHDLLLVLMLHIVWINHNMLANIPVMMTNDLRMRMVLVCWTVIHKHIRILSVWTDH